MGEWFNVLTAVNKVTLDSVAEWIKQLSYQYGYSHRKILRNIPFWNPVNLWNSQVFRKRMSRYPAMVVELKWNKSTEGAIEQINERNYPAAIRDYGGEIVLVGINYDEKTKKHSCLIEHK